VAAPATSEDVARMQVRFRQLLPEIVVQGLFAKFVDSLYYSKSELSGGALMVSF
jgi:hypothetical protein